MKRSLAMPLPKDELTKEERAAEREASRRHMDAHDRMSMIHAVADAYKVLVEGLESRQRTEAVANVLVKLCTTPPGTSVY
jgi:hypothetical protein